MGSRVYMRIVLAPILLAVGAVAATPAIAAQHEGESVPTVLITGSSRGIGLEFARQYAALGWRVIATCRNPEAADDLRAVAARHANLTVARLDLIDHPGIDALAAQYAGTPIDLLLNNAALLGPRSEQAFGDIDYTLFEQILAVNTIGTLKVTEAFRPHVAASNQKKIVTLGSAAGSINMINPPADFYAYRASKAALHLLMRNAALDLAGQGIIVALINPGLVDTRGFADIGPEDPVPKDFEEVVRLIRSGALKLSSPADAVAAMIELIGNLSPEQAGVFMNFDGQVLPW